MKSFRAAVLGILLLAPGLVAGDLSGIWIGQAPGRRGPLDLSFQFIQDGEALSGKLYRDYGSAPIIEGRFDGEAIEFVVVVREQAGNEVNLVSYRYNGKVVDGELELTRERTQAVNAVSGAEFVIRRRAADEGKPPPKIRLRRLL